MNESVIDRSVAVTDDEAKAMSHRLAREEGIFVGLFAGAAVAAAVKIAERAEPGAAILALLPDTGERYLSTWLFEGNHASGPPACEPGTVPEACERIFLSG